MGILRPFIQMLIFWIILFPVTAGCEEKPLWEIGAGGVLLQMPDYRGSDESRRYLFLYPYLVYRGDILRVEKERISGRILETDRLLLDISLNGSVPVSSSDNRTRQGMADLDPTFEIGPSLNLTLLENRQDRYKLALTLPVRAAFSTDFSSVRHAGWVFHPRLVFEKADMVAGSGLNLGISAGPRFADRDYHRYFYTVDPPFATPSRPAYEAGGGYSGSTLTVGLNKRIKPVIMNAFFSVDFLQGAAFGGSPLVKKEYAVMAGFTVSWVFWSSSRMAQTRN